MSFLSQRVGSSVKMEDDFGESSFYQKFSSIAGTEKHKKGGKLFFIRKPDSASNTDKANKKKGRVFCITRADDVIQKYNF